MKCIKKVQLLMIASTSFLAGSDAKRTYCHDNLVFDGVTASKNGNTIAFNITDTNVKIIADSAWYYTTDINKQSVDRQRLCQSIKTAVEYGCRFGCETAAREYQSSFEHLANENKKKFETENGKLKKELAEVKGELEKAVVLLLKAKENDNSMKVLTQEFAQTKLLVNTLGSKYQAAQELCDERGEDLEVMRIQIETLKEAGAPNAQLEAKLKTAENQVTQLTAQVKQLTEAAGANSVNTKEVTSQELFFQMWSKLSMRQKFCLVAFNTLIPALAIFGLYSFIRFIR